MTPMLLIALALLLVPVVVIGAARALHGWLARPRIAEFAGRDLLILAAHPDDCAIMGGEIAQGVLARGGRVRIVYLTCGAESSAAPRAAVRRAEAVAAWSRLGVPESDLVFLGHPHTDAASGACFTPAMGREALASIAGTLEQLSMGAVVLVPAAGELHADHRALRKAALDAIATSARADLSVLEAPEYSPYLSIRSLPGAAARFLLGAIPLAGRLAGPARHTGPAFFSGEPGFVLGPEASRLERKREFLRAFTSENGGDVLVGLFGFPDRWRAVDLRDPGAATRGFIPLDGRMISPGLGACLLAVDGGLLVLAMAAGQFAVASSSNSPPVEVGVAGLGLVVVVLALARSRSQARRWALLCAGCGLLAGALPLAIR